MYELKDGSSERENEMVLLNCKRPVLTGSHLMDGVADSRSRCKSRTQMSLREERLSAVLAVAKEVDCGEHEPE